MDLGAAASRAVRRSVEGLRGFGRRWTGGTAVQGFPPGEPGTPAGGEPAAKRRRRASGAGSGPGRLPEEPVLEVCVDTVGGVRELSERNAECAARNPAGGPVTRVELCSALSEGGLTPSHGLAKKALESAAGRFQVFAMVRPRAGDFVYTQEELDVMVEDIRQFHALGVHGVVFGVLTEEGGIERGACAMLAALCRSLGLNFTFHRAFDLVADMAGGLEDLIALGFPRVLASGGRPTAPEGLGTLKDLAARCRGRLSLMVGSGVNAANVGEFVHPQLEGGFEVHSSCKQPARSPASAAPGGLIATAAERGLCFSTSGNDYVWNVASPDLAERTRGALDEAYRPR